MTSHPRKEPRLRGRQVTRLEAFSDAVFGLAATLLALGLALAAGMGSPAWADGPARFRLDVLTADWEDLERAQDWESAWPRLQKAAGEVLFSLDERDVAAYDWQAQRIVLEPEASLRLLAAAQKLPGLPERLYKLRALWSTGDLGSIVRRRGFVVSLDGRPLYGGIFLDKSSNLSMDYPVIHAAIDGSRRIVLRFSPIQFSFGSLWDDGTGDALEPTTDSEVLEIQAAFPDARPQSEEEVERFKRLLLDPGVKALFAGLGIPAEPAAVPVAERPERPPVLLSANPFLRDEEEGWSLFFGYPDDVSEIRYRLAGDPDWSVVGPQGQAPLGKLAPGRHTIAIEALDFAGERAGRYTFQLDPERESILLSRHILEMTLNSWASFSDREDWDETCVGFGHLRSHGDALKEVRYSFDGCELDRRVPLSGDEERHCEWQPKAVSYACVQLVYRDGETAGPRRFYHHPEEIARLATPPAAAEAPASGPVTLSTSVSSSGWMLLFRFEPSAREVRYRFGVDPEWRSTGPDNHVNLVTGERFPRTWLVLPAHELTLGRHRIEVKLTGWDGVESGPYTVWFDPEREILDRGKSALLGTEGVEEWAGFDDEDDDTRDRVLFQFLEVVSHLEALREVRYSLDGCALDRRLPFHPWTYLGEDQGDVDYGYVWLPKTVRSACVQLVFRDGQVTEPRQFFRKPAG